MALYRLGVIPHQPVLEQHLGLHGFEQGGGGLCWVEVECQGFTGGPEEEEGRGVRMGFIGDIVRKVTAVATMKMREPGARGAYRPREALGARHSRPTLEGGRGAPAAAAPQGQRGARLARAGPGGGGRAFPGLAALWRVNARGLGREHVEVAASQAVHKAVPRRRKPQLFNRRGGGGGGGQPR